MTESKKLLVRLPNWIGDTIMSLPAIFELQNQNIKLILLGKPWIHSLIGHLNIPLLSLPKDEKQTIQLIKKLPYKNILLFPNSFSTARIARLSGKKSIGYAKNLRTLVLSKAIPIPENFHETKQYNYLTQKALKYFFNIDNIPFSTTIPILQPSLKSIADAKKILHQYDVKEPYLVICPFAQGISPDKRNKQWPFWKDLIKKISDLPIVICPGPQELDEAINYQNTVIIPNTSLDIYHAILSNASLVIANDSGPMHLAAATQTSSIGLFGVTHPNKTGPRNAVLMGDYNCWPCLDDVLIQINNHLKKLKHAQINGF